MITLGQLNSRILNEYESLSPRLRQIAQFAVDHPNDMALKTTAVIAQRAGVQPSTIVRFAKAFGFDGFSDMQRVFQTGLTENASSYRERVRRLRESKHLEGDEPRLHDLLQEFCEVNTISLEHLRYAVSAEMLDRATDMLAQARTVHLCGLRRSFPVATYLTYALGRIGCAANLIDGMGGQLDQQARCLLPEDALVAISFPPYAPETADVVARARETGCTLVVITDSQLSPLAGHADECFAVPDAELYTFRSLTASMCLAQTLAVGVGLRLEKVPAES